MFLYHSRDVKLCYYYNNFYLANSTKCINLKKLCLPYVAQQAKSNIASDFKE